ncbi:MAG: amino acid adenylation domain-containing protein [Sulfuricella sp.]|nr:amino acid adenylation domain-containing protein [Sulfuricella sp.]
MNKIENLFLRLKRLNVSLWLDEETGELRFKAPKGALDDILREEMKAAKDDIRRFLEEMKGDRQRADTSLVTAPRDAALPLSFAQQRLWFLYRMEGRSAAYNIPACRRIVGKLDAGLLERSLNEVVRRHEILRTRFAVRGDEAEQVIAPSLWIPVPLLDLSILDKAAQEAGVASHVAAETGHCFDLETGPLLRLSLVRLSAEEHVLTLVIHHIVGDGWSMAIFIGELTAAYRAFAAGSAPDLPELAVQYADFAVWQRRWFDEGGMARQLAYWKDQLAGVPQLLELPADRPRPPTQSYRGGVEFFSINGELKRRLDALCKQENASLFMGLCAAFNALIQRYTGRDDIVTGTHTAGRTRQEQEALIGFFINTLPLRVDLSGAPSFREVLRRTARTALDAFSHQDVPFEKLVELVQPERNMSHAPLVQVMCVLQNMPVGQSDLAGLSVETIPLERATSKFDLSLLMEEGEAGVACELEFNGDLFERERIQRMAGHFTILLEALVDQPDAGIAACSLLSPAERHTILEGFSQPIRAYQPLAITGNIVAAFEAQVARRGDGVAVAHDGAVLSYRELNARANRLARHLQEQGVARESVVALCLDNAPQMIVAMLAILKAGGCYLPLEPDYPDERIAFLLRDAAVAQVVTQPVYRERFARIGAGGVILVDAENPALARHPDANLNEVIAPDQLAYLIYTSGSTGEPKGVMIEHHSVLNLVEGLADTVYRGVNQPLRVALLASIVFDASVQQIFGALLQGHALHLVNKTWKQDGARLIAFLRDNAIEVCDGTPTLLAVMMEAGLADTRQTGLARLIIGGEALPRQLAQKVADCGFALTNVYGPTECCVDTTAYAVENGSAIGSPGGSVPIGRPLGRCRAYLLDGLGNPVPLGVDGELYLSGAGLFRGYVNRPDLTAGRRLPNPFADGADVYSHMYRSGDICHWLADGNIAFVGRNDDQVKIRGYRIEPGEIEAHLAAHPLVREAAVLAQANAQGAMELAAYLTLKGELDVPALHAYLKERMPEYMVPAAFYVLPAMPVNKSGKIDRKALVAGATPRASLARGERHVAPRNERERLLCAMFGAILNVEAVGIRDNFFFLGGDSIKALQIAARLHRENWVLEIRNLFLHPNVEELAPTLREVKASVARKTEFTGTVPLTAVQRGFFAVYGDTRRHFNQSVLLCAAQRLDAAALAAALQAVVARHDALRLRFVEREGCYVQEYGTPALGFETAECPPGAAPQQFLADRSAALQRRVDPAGATVQAGLYRLPDGDRLFIAIHHLVVDTVSWRALFDDLDAAYRQAAAGQTPALPPAPPSFGEWAEAVRDYANGAALKHLDYWKTIDAADVPELPLDFAGPTCTHGDCATRSVRLSPAITALLLTEAHEAYNTGIDDLLLAAFARCLRKWRGVAQTLVMLEGHGREQAVADIGIGATVGWFTSLYPLLLGAGADEAPGRQIKRIKEKLRRIPDKGVGYGILRYVTDPHRLGGHEFRAAPKISFNYLGRFDAEVGTGTFALSTEATSPNIDPAAPQPFLLEMVGMVLGDTLEITAGYSTRHFREESIAQMLDLYRSELMFLVDYAATREERELTPADIDYTGFDQQALDEFVESCAGMA